MVRDVLFALLATGGFFFLVVIVPTLLSPQQFLWMWRTIMTILIFVTFFFLARFWRQR